MAKIKLQVDADLGSAPGDFDKLNEKLAKMGINISGISGKAANTKKELSGWDNLLKNFGIDVAKIATGFGVAELAIAGAKKAVGLFLAEYKEVVRIQDEMAKNARTYNETVIVTVGNNAALQSKIEASADALKASRSQMMGYFGTAKKVWPGASDQEALQLAEGAVGIRAAIGAANVEPMIKTTGTFKDAYPGITLQQARDYAAIAFKETGRNGEALAESGKVMEQFAAMDVSAPMATALGISMSKSDQGAKGGAALANWLNMDRQTTAEYDPVTGKRNRHYSSLKNKLAAMTVEEQIIYAMNNIDNPELGLMPSMKAMLGELKRASGAVASGSGAYGLLAGETLSGAGMQAEAGRQLEAQGEGVRLDDIGNRETGLLREAFKSGVKDVTGLASWRKGLYTKGLDFSNATGGEFYNEALESVRGMQLDVVRGQRGPPSPDQERSIQELERLYRILVQIHESSEKMRQEAKERNSGRSASPQFNKVIQHGALAYVPGMTFDG